MAHCSKTTWFRGRQPQHAAASSCLPEDRHVPPDVRDPPPVRARDLLCGETVNKPQDNQPDPTTGPVAVPTTDKAKGTFPKDAEEQERLQRKEDERARLAGEKP